MKKASMQLKGRSGKWWQQQKDKAIGVNTLDIELATWSRTSNSLKFLGYPQVHFDGPLDLEAAVMGTVPVFKFTGAAALVSSMYPKGFSTRIYRDPITGRTKTVPRSVPLTAGPRASFSG